MNSNLEVAPDTYQGFSYAKVNNRQRILVDIVTVNRNVWHLWLVFDLRLCQRDKHRLCRRRKAHEWISRLYPAFLDHIRHLCNHLVLSMDWSLQLLSCTTWKAGRITSFNLLADFILWLAYARYYVPCRFLQNIVFAKCCKPNVQ